MGHPTGLFIVFLIQSPLPNLQFECAILVDQLEVGAVGGNQRCAVRAGGERNQHVKVEVTQLAPFAPREQPD